VKMQSTWKFQTRKSGYEWECSLVAYWEVELDPMSDGYTPEEITAADLLRRWADRVREKHPGQLIPIYWNVESVKGTEFMPCQFKHVEWQEDFLTFFTSPVHAQTGAPLNWLTLPVVDKHWNTARGDKGGFIQEATGWKPAILQPYVYLPSLMEAVAR
jgi:hypothetical protein